MVADNGKGISAADIPHIFERMYQCDHSRSAKGNGLGLSIAKELVSVHKGTITAASVPRSWYNLYHHTSESPVTARRAFFRSKQG